MVVKKKYYREMRNMLESSSNEIIIEVLTTLDNFKIEIAEIRNLIYDSGKILEDMSRSVFMALQKKQCAIECDLH